MQVAARSEVGYVRTRNEDAHLVEIGEDGDGVFVVADGMGGHPAGDVASRVAIEALRESLVAPQPASADNPAGADNPAEVLRAALVAANEAVGRAARRDPGRVGMGTTAVVLTVTGGLAWVGHVGDSRAYQFSADGRLTRLTVDHQHGGYITQALGLESRVRPDLRQVPAEGLVLLCSDGLTNMVDDEDIERVLAHASDVQEGCDALVTAALEAGGLDNVTVVAVLL